MTVSLCISFVVAFIIALILGPIMIPLLKKLKVGNTEREELKSHQIKVGTPTMGGLIFLPAILITSIIFSFSCPKIVPIIVLTMGFGIIGFIDDYLKVVLRRSDGLIAWQKLLLQIIVTTIFLVYLVFYTDVSLAMLLPFSGGQYIDLGWVAIPVLYIAVLGTVNGVNFTDGLDGLATTVTIIVATFFVYASLVIGGHVESMAAMTAGALVAFLIYNAFPAKVFMGDTGSLALGGFVVGMAYMLQIPLFILIVGFIYLIEVISVILQVGYFKLTHGKRIFRMAPIHHHFELGGWSEKKVVAVFSIVTICMCVVGVIGLFGV